MYWSTLWVEDLSEAGGGGYYRYVLALFGTVFFWGTSFPVIKVLMGSVDEYTYVWVRGFLSIIFLSPYIGYLYVKEGVYWRCLLGGLFSGVFYSLGLFFQGWGTAYTSASNSAFITGLNVLLVYLFSSMIYRRFDKFLIVNGLLAILGLYLLLSPTSTGRFGDSLVLISAFMWALQVLTYDKYASKCSPFILVYGTFLPTLLYMNPLDGYRALQSLGANQLLLFTYLALICNIAAFTLQAYGQKKVKPETTATIFLLEPVIATTISHTTLGETLTPKQITGATIILTTIYTTIKRKWWRDPTTK